MYNIFESLEDHDYSIEKTLAAYIGMDEDLVRDFTKDMSLSDYTALVNALDTENENDLTKIVDKYLSNSDEDATPFSFYDKMKENEDIFEINTKKLEEEFYNFLREARPSTIIESDIYSKFDLNEQQLYRSFIPESINQAFSVIDRMTYESVCKYIGKIHEGLDQHKARDMAIIRHVMENALNPQLKANIAKVAKTSPNAVKAPSFTDEKTKKTAAIVSADPKSNTIATQDEKGEVKLHDVKNPNVAKQIALEAMKKLAGIK
jgi:hypothetical protein